MFKYAVLVFALAMIIGLTFSLLNVAYKLYVEHAAPYAAIGVGIVTVGVIALLSYGTYDICKMERDK